MYMNYFFFREKYIPLLEKVLFPQIFLRNKTSLKNVQLYTGSTPIKLHLNNEFCLRDTDSDNACYGWRHQCSFPGSSAGKESTCNVGDSSLIPGLGRSPGEEKGYPLQYSGLENFIDCIVHGVTKSWTQLRDFHFHFLR